MEERNKKNTKSTYFQKNKKIDKIDGGITNQNFKIKLINNKSYFCEEYVKKFPSI